MRRLALIAVLLLATAPVHAQALTTPASSCIYFPPPEEPAPPPAWDLGFIKGPPGGVWWILEPPNALGQLYRNDQPVPVELIDFNEGATGIRIPSDANVADVFRVDWADRAGGLTLPIDTGLRLDEGPIATPIPGPVERGADEVWSGGGCNDTPEPEPEPTMSHDPYAEVYWGVSPGRSPFPSDPPEFLLNVWLTPADAEPTLDPDDRMIALREPAQYRKRDRTRLSEIMIRVDDTGSWAMTVEYVDLLTGRKSMPMSQAFDVSVDEQGVGCSSLVVEERAPSGQAAVIALAFFAALFRARRRSA